MNRSRLCVGRHALLMLPLLLAAGCSRGVDVAAPVEPNLAREALKTTLEAWKQGEPPEALRERKPEIVAQDADWLAGATLLAYEPAGPEKTSDANLLCPVKLTLRDPAGKESTKTVTYIVGTDPVLTVFRQAF